MNTITIAICDASKADRNSLLRYLKKSEQELNRTYEIHIFSSGVKLLENPGSVFDIVFLDAELPDMSSRDLAKRLHECNRHLYLVFLSSSPESFSIGYEYNAKNFLLKPLNYLHILKEMKKFLNYEYLLSESFLWISNQNGMFKIYYSRLRFIETDYRHLLLHYDNMVFRHPARISEFEAGLSKDMFFRCNNSYIVNLRYVESIIPDGNRYRIRLFTGEILPLSRNKYRDITKRLQDYRMPLNS